MVDDPCSQGRSLRVAFAFDFARTESDSVMVRTYFSGHHVTERFLHERPASWYTGVHSVDTRRGANPLVDLAPYASMHTLLYFHQASRSRDQSRELHGLLPAPLTREHMGSPIEPVPIAFDEVEVTDQYVERALFHIAS